MKRELGDRCNWKDEAAQRACFTNNSLEKWIVNHTGVMTAQKEERWGGILYPNYYVRMLVRTLRRGRILTLYSLTICPLRSSIWSFRMVLEILRLIPCSLEPISKQQNVYSKRLVRYLS